MDRWVDGLDGWIDGNNRGKRGGRIKWGRYSSTAFDPGEYICKWGDSYTFDH